jgi:hypothetical protein
MASFQDSIRVFLQDKLNNATNNPLVQSGTTFKLYNRYEIEEQDFYDFVLDSINWEDEDPFLPPYEGFTLNDEYDTLAQLNNAGASAQVPGIVYFLEFGSPFKYLTYNEETTNYDGIEEEDLFNPNASPSNNVVVDFEGENYNTQFGQYTLNRLTYIPSIIENFMGEFEPLKFVRNVAYTIPLTFYINETFNRELDNKIIEAVEVFQDKIRGEIEIIYDHNVLLNHGDITPLTGVIDFNGTVFREYQVIIYMEAVKTILPTNAIKPFFGNQIEYRLTVDGLFEQNGTPQKFRVYPVAVSSVRSNELHMFQKFSTAITNEFQMKSLPNESAFTIELTFLYTGDSFTKFLFQQRYAQEEPRTLLLEVKYPAMAGDNQIPMEQEYVIESIGGAESVGDKILLTIVLRPVSEVYI